MLLLKLDSWKYYIMILLTSLLNFAFTSVILVACYQYSGSVYPRKIGEHPMLLPKERINIYQYIILKFTWYKGKCCPNTLTL
jgi:hypothetical protein